MIYLTPHAVDQRLNLTENGPGQHHPTSGYRELTSRCDAPYYVTPRSPPPKKKHPQHYVSTNISVWCIHIYICICMYIYICMYIKTYYYVDTHLSQQIRFYIIGQHICSNSKAPGEWCSPCRAAPALGGSPGSDRSRASSEPGVALGKSWRVIVWYDRNRIEHILGIYCCYNYRKSSMVWYDDIKQSKKNIYVFFYGLV